MHYEDLSLLRRLSIQQQNQQHQQQQKPFSVGTKQDAQASPRGRQKRPSLSPEFVAGMEVSGLASTSTSSSTSASASAGPARIDVSPVDAPVAATKTKASKSTSARKKPTATDAEPVPLAAVVVEPAPKRRRASVPVAPLPAAADLTKSEINRLVYDSRVRATDLKALFREALALRGCLRGTITVEGVGPKAMSKATARELGKHLVVLMGAKG